MSAKKTLAIVQWGSYRSYPVGGISTFVESMIPHLGRAFDLKLVGMSLGEHIGRWTKIQVAGDSYDFLPVVSARQSRVIPDRLRLAFAISTFHKVLREAKVDAYYVHMTEAAAPLLAWGGAPVVVHVHGLYNLFRFSRHLLGRPFSTAYNVLYPYLFSRCSKVLGAGTQAELDSFRKVMRVRAAALVPTCVREGVFYPRDRRVARRVVDVREDQRVLLYVGRMTETKNPELLLQAAQLLRKRFQNLLFVFVGDGPLRERVEAEALRTGDILCTGPLPAGYVALWMNAADVLTIVSRTEAFTSIAALEALSCGLPVAATPVSALPEMIRPGVNGEVSADFSPESYATAVEELLVEPPVRESCIETASPYSSYQVALRVISELEGVLGAVQ